MITKMTGILSRVLDEEVRVQIGPLEYQVLVTEIGRRHLQMLTGTEITLHISEYLEGNSVGSRFIPRLIGFLTEAEIDFFDLFCTVDKIGVKKALKAMARPIHEIAHAISRDDTKWLTTLPGIGASSAEQIIAALKRKVARFTAMAPTPPEAGSGKTPSRIDPQLTEDIYCALLSLGLTPTEARNRLDQLLQSGVTVSGIEDAIAAIFKR